MIADQNVREQVLDTQRSFLVQAPAGSGKTSLLVQRFLSLLAEAEKAPEEILAITFTRKAAAEMRARIVDALQLGLQAEPQNAYLAQTWRLAKNVLQRDKLLNWDLLYNPARLKIQTIDALCTNITKQMPIISRFGAQPQIEPRAEVLYAKAVDLLLQDLGQSTPWQVALCMLLGYLANDRIKLKRLLVDMLAMREQWIATLVQTAQKSNLRQILEHSLELAIQQALQGLTRSIPAELDFSIFLAQKPQTLNEWLILSYTLLTDDGSWRKVLSAKQGFPAQSQAGTKQEAAELKLRKERAMQQIAALAEHETFRSELHGLRSLPSRKYTDQQWEMIDALLVVLPVLAAQLTLVFKETGKVDFSEVNLAALSALEFDLNDKFQHILVDEFQDTSITQFKLLEALTADWQDGDGRTLFLVGDPMQSIYRFRQAEVGLFLKVKSMGINQVKPIFANLTVNFRSTAPVITWINKVFSACFPSVDDMQSGAISYMPACAADQVANEYAAFECFNVSTDQDAQLIVEIIQRTHSQDPNKSIAILVRAKTHLVDILPALRQAQIAYQGVDLETLAESPLIQDLLALTKAILHLDDRIAWLAILRAPWCGLALADLQEIANYGGTILEALAHAAVERSPRLLRLQNVMQAMLNDIGQQPLNVLVKSTWHALGGLECLRACDQQREAQAYFELLGELADQPEIYKSGYLEEQLANLFLKPAISTKAAVQVMTMHKAKGLEFDIVILYGLDKATRGNSQQLLLLERRDFDVDYLLMAPIKASMQNSDSIYDYLAYCEQQRQDYEATRLLYVAFTRAREKIYCITSLADKEPRANSSLATIWPYIAQQQVAYSVANAVLTIPQPKMLQRLPASWYLQHPFQPLTKNLADSSISVWQADWLRLAGIVVHRVFWQIATSGAASINRRSCQLHLKQLGISADHYDQAEALVNLAIDNALSDPLAQNILSNTHKESYAEWRLTVAQGQDFKQLVIDRAFLDREQVFWIVDYKVVESPNQKISDVNNHKAQMFQYIDAVQKLRPGLKVRAQLYFPVQKQCFDIT